MSFDGAPRYAFTGPILQHPFSRHRCWRVVQHRREAYWESIDGVSRLPQVLPSSFRNAGRALWAEDGPIGDCIARERERERFGRIQAEVQPSSAEFGRVQANIGRQFAGGGRILKRPHQVRCKIRQPPAKLDIAQIWHEVNRAWSDSGHLRCESDRHGPEPARF